MSSILHTYEYHPLPGDAGITQHQKELLEKP